MKTYIDAKKFNESISHIEGMFSLGGMSECGKSTAGLHLQKLGIVRLKIIKFEEKMMRHRGYDLSNGMKEDYFVELYSSNTEEVLKEFLYLVSKYMEENNIKYASLESMYRPQMAQFLKDTLKEKMANIYIEANIDQRAKREWLKYYKDSNTLEEITKKVKEKDKFKIRNGANKVKDVADYIIDNSGSLESLITNIDNIVKVIRK